MKNLLKANRRKINQDLNNIRVRRYFSPALLGLSKMIESAIDTYGGGRLLDIGCGDMPYKDMISEKVSQYEALDINQHVSGVTYVGDIQNMHMIKQEEYDTTACFEVLEHVPDPFKAVCEIHRILKKDGIAIITVPHLSRLHEEPHDYYRYTHYGIRYLLEAQGFEILEIKATGSILSFLGHQMSTLTLGLTWHIKVVRIIFFVLNKWLCVIPCHLLDKLLFKESMFPLGYICVARKKE